MKNKIFLLGGHDLEMFTIRDLLDEKGIPYIDKGLAWHEATLSQYADTLELYNNLEIYELYGVELQEDILPPNNYHLIDHHNNSQHQLSALGQVASLLQVKLDRHQQLVSANDKGYIPAMKEMVATPEEIKQIREADRQAQGVTETDERLAKLAVENRTVEHNVIVVKSETNRFSPITDRLFPYSKLLIYTNSELIYYGKGKELLVRHFQNKINEKKFFYGGRDNGFIGSIQNIYTPEEIIQLKQEILNIVSNV